MAIKKLSNSNKKNQNVGDQRLRELEELVNNGPSGGGKVDDVKVNGVSVLSGKTANITVPTKVSDLPNDADYATQQDVEDSAISEVEATIDDNVGTPDVDVTLTGHKLTLAFQNLLGDGIASIEQTTTSQESEGINVVTVTTVGGNVATFQVRNGKQGDTVILDQQGIDVYKLYNGTGQNTDGAMTQKAVTDALAGITYDISAANGGITYADLSVALGNNGSNIPANLRKGGMSVKFVQSPDNKYVQARCIADEFTTDITAWVDEDNLSLHTIESNESLNFADGNGNVVLNVKGGHVRTKNFDSRAVAPKNDLQALSDREKQDVESLTNAIAGKQKAGNYVEEEIGRDATKLYFKDEEGNVVVEFAGGEIMTKHFNSKSALVSKGKGQNFNLIDSFGNVILSIKDGYIATSNFKSKGLSTLLNSLLGRIMNIEKDDVLLNRKMVPAISWVDDDFATESAKIGCLTIYRNWCNINNIHGDIALIPDAVIDRQNQDISRVYFTDDRKALLEAFENEGFEFLVHPPHDGLYTGGGWNTQWSDEYIRKNLAMTVRCFLENNLVPDILVYPGASGGVAEVIKCAKKYFTCAIQPSGGAVGIPTNRYNLKRVNMDNISAERTVTQIKQEIASAISNGYWIILCSHVWMCTGDGTEATDETSMSFANLFDIVTYANTLSAIKPVRQVWRDRSILWDYYTNIN